MNEANRSNRICAGTRADGSPCTARVMGAGRYCFAHDPAREADREAARAKGGQNRSAAARANALIPATLRPVLYGLLEAFEEVKAGTRDPRTGTALATIASAICRVYTAGTLEERVAALEAAQAAQNTEDVA